MKISEITSSAGVTVGQPGFSSIRYDYSARATLDEGESHEAAQGALDDLERLHPGIRARICDEAGAVKKFINLFANDEDIRGLQDLDTPLRDSDELSIVPAIAGG